MAGERRPASTPRAPTIGELFRDADQHGPRAPRLAARIVPAALLLAASVELALVPQWRELLAAGTAPALVDGALVVPVLVAIVLLGAAASPLARVPAPRMLAAGVLLLAVSAVVTRGGHVVDAAIPGVLAALALGIVAARAVRRAVWVLPLIVVAAASDLHSVETGLTRRLLDGAAAGADTAVASSHLAPVARTAAESVELLDYLVVHLPAAGGIWLFGLVDVAAIGLLFGLCHLHWLPAWRTVLATIAVLAATTLASVPVAVLPLLGLAWLAVNARLVWRSSRFTLRRMLYLGG